MTGANNAKSNSVLSLGVSGTGLASKCNMTYIERISIEPKEDSCEPSA